MINFIICDDNNMYVEKIKNIVENYMMNFDIECKYHLFEDYDPKFEHEMEKLSGFNICIFDIETKVSSGIDAARYIREELDDWNTVIILLTAHNELKYEALGNRLYLFDFINKFDNYQERIKEDLERIKKNYDNRQKCLTFEINRVVKRVDFKHIIYIEKEKDSKRCLLKTTYSDYVVFMTLNNILKKLDNRFIKTSRSLIINVDQVKEYDSAENKIVFKNGLCTYDISRAYKKKVFDNVRSVSK